MRRRGERNTKLFPMPKGDEMKLLRTEAVIGWILDDIITNYT
jgi:hypothetical protein